jgi:CrcB protein
MFASSIAVAVGGALGSLARFWLTELCIRWLGATFPWGTVLVNITGCFIIGFFTIIAGPDGRLPMPPVTRLFVMIGICGGYTTFSSFSLQTITMLQRNDWLPAALNISGSVVLCLLATFAGVKAAAILNHLNAVPT